MMLWDVLKIALQHLLIKERLQKRNSVFPLGRVVMWWEKKKKFQQSQIIASWKTTERYKAKDMETKPAAKINELIHNLWWCLMLLGWNRSVCFQPCNIFVIKFGSLLEITKFSVAVRYCSISLRVSGFLSFSLGDCKNHWVIFNSFLKFTLPLQWGSWIKQVCFKWTSIKHAFVKKSGTSNVKFIYLHKWRKELK